jgi:hypothetical protein
MYVMVIKGLSLPLLCAKAKTMPFPFDCKAVDYSYSYNKYSYISVNNFMYRQFPGYVTCDLDTLKPMLKKYLLLLFSDIIY